jgi:hypothetical protein
VDDVIREAVANSNAVVADDGGIPHGAPAGQLVQQQQLLAQLLQGDSTAQLASEAAYRAEQQQQ